MLILHPWQHALTSQRPGKDEGLGAVLLFYITYVEHMFHTELTELVNIMSDLVSVDILSQVDKQQV